MNLLSRIRSFRHKIDSYPRAKYAFALLCIFLGVFAFFTPFTPGSWLVLVGIELFGFRSLLGKHVAAQMEKFFPTKKSR